MSEISNELKDEVQSGNLTPQPITMETEDSSSAPTTKDYTTQNNKSQGNTEVDTNTL